jgi:hypothetical protein
MQPHLRSRRVKNQLVIAQRRTSSYTYIDKKKKKKIETSEILNGVIFLGSVVMAFSNMRIGCPYVDKG